MLPVISTSKVFSRTYIDHRDALGPGREKTDVSFPMHNFLTCDMHNTQSGCFPSYERLLQYNSTVSFMINKETSLAISEPSV